MQNRSDDSGEKEEAVRKLLNASIEKRYYATRINLAPFAPLWCSMYMDVYMYMVICIIRHFIILFHNVAKTTLGENICV